MLKSHAYSITSPSCRELSTLVSYRSHCDESSLMYILGFMFSMWDANSVVIQYTQEAVLVIVIVIVSIQHS